MVVTVPRSPQNWQPRTWKEIVANKEIKEALHDWVASVRLDLKFEPFRLYAYGESRGGKSATISYAIKCVTCSNLNLTTLDACHECSNCKARVELFGNQGIDAVVEWEGLDGQRHSFYYNYRKIDCTGVTEKELEDYLLDLRYQDKVLHINYWDEFHRLATRSWDERLLIAVENFVGVTLASSAILGKLENMLQSRFDYVISVEKPTTKVLRDFLAERCEEAGIRCENAKATLTKLAELSKHVPGNALRVIRKAYMKRDKILTEEMVDKHFYSVAQAAEQQKNVP
jgi:hypothetical protein